MTIIEGGYVPSRRFSGSDGDPSLGFAGIDQLEKTLDLILAVLNKTITVVDPITGEEYQGGVGSNNLQANAVTDSSISPIEPNDTIATAPEGSHSYLTLISLLAKQLKDIVGSGNWYDTPSETLQSLSADQTSIRDDVNTNASQVALRLLSAQYTAPDILAKLLTVDVDGSGLNANYLQGKTLAEIEAQISGGLVDDSIFWQHLNTSLQAILDGKADFYTGPLDFVPGVSLQVNHTQVTENTIVKVFPQETAPDDKIGIWSIESANGSFTITSDPAETKTIPFIYEFLK